MCNVVAEAMRVRVHAHVGRKVLRSKVLRSKVFRTVAPRACVSVLTRVRGHVGGDESRSSNSVRAVPHGHGRAMR
jgi:hypothetical protein